MSDLIAEARAVIAQERLRQAFLQLAGIDRPSNLLDTATKLLAALEAVTALADRWSAHPTYPGASHGAQLRAALTPKEE